jgi:hypothetical protein
MMNRTTTLLALLTTVVLFTACDDDDDDDHRVDAPRDVSGAVDSATDARADVSGADTRDAGIADARADAVDAPAADAAVADAAGADAAAAPTWTQVYSSVIATRCAPCHTTAGGTGISSGRLDMTTQAAAYTNLVSAAAMGSACTGMGTRVVPGNAETSLLYLKVSVDDPTPCGGKMPLGGPALTEAQAEMIEDWIDDGAPNN